jgi:large subunit ribosomal protein L18
MYKKQVKRSRVFGTASRPRLAVYRSLKSLYVQIIDDDASHTLLGMSSLSPKLKEQLKGKSNIEAAKQFGGIVAQAALAQGIKQVVFDRAGRKYHGKIKALADAARAGGLAF